MRLQRRSGPGWAITLGLWSSFLLISSGCEQSGPRLAPGKPVTIVIQYDGHPLSAGQVDLSGTGGGAAINQNGEAVFAHVPMGEYRVIVLPPLSMDAVIPTEETSHQSTQKKKTTADPHTSIPKQFRDEMTTPLRIVVDSGSKSTFQFDLKK